MIKFKSIITGMLMFFISIPVSSVFSQNLIINPSLDDLNLCCEFNQRCRPEGWYSIPQIGHFALKNKQEQYLTVNCKKTVGGKFCTYYAVALVKQVDPSFFYNFNIKLPGNHEVWMYYAFMDSSLVFSDSTQEIISKLDAIKFDSVLIHGKKERFRTKPNQAGGYLILCFHKFNRKDDRSYNQYVEYIELEEIGGKRMNAEDVKNRMNEVYGENRAHLFQLKCPERTIDLRK